MSRHRRHTMIDLLWGVVGAVLVLGMVVAWWRNGW
jgi:hypothetical protein